MADEKNYEDDKVDDDKSKNNQTKVLSETNNENARNAILAGIVQISDGVNQINSKEIDINFPCTSTGINTEIKSNVVSEQSQPVATPEQFVTKFNPDVEVQTDPNSKSSAIETIGQSPPAYMPTSKSDSQYPMRCIIFEPFSEYQISITPPLFPPTVFHGPPPIHGAPPTYSAIMAIGQSASMQRQRSVFHLFGRRQPEIRIQPSAPFIAPIPPPSYAETEGLCVMPNRPVVAGALDLEDNIIWGTEPASAVCPQCGHYVLTSTRTHRSNITHFSAFALCMCGCWPCCLLPYCLKSCKTTYHECPVCLSVIGVYNPW